MSGADDTERQLRMALMQTQIELLKKQSRWEVTKSLAAFLGASALMTGAIIGLANWWSMHPPVPPAAPQTVIVLPPGSTVTVPK